MGPIFDYSIGGLPPAGKGSWEAGFPRGAGFGAGAGVNAVYK